jgi:hypothetical protein
VVIYIKLQIVESALLEILHLDIMSVGTSMKCPLAQNHSTYEWEAPMVTHLFGRLSRLVVVSDTAGCMVRFLKDGPEVVCTAHHVK